MISIPKVFWLMQPSWPGAPTLTICPTPIITGAPVGLTVTATKSALLVVSAADLNIQIVGEC